MTNIKRVGVLSFARFQSFLLALVGLVAGIVYAFGGLIIDALASLKWISTAETPGLSIGTVYAFGALLGMPLIFALFGFLTGIIEALLYNLFANWFGGLDLEFD